MSELVRREWLTCPYCGKVIERRGFRGRLEEQLRYHQETAKCLKARVRALESNGFIDKEGLR